MFVEDLEGSWEDNPFGNRRFLLQTNAQVDRLKHSKVVGVIINTALGLDVAGAAAPAPAKTRETRKHADNPLKKEERVRLAAETVMHSEAAVARLFEDVRQGGAISFQLATPVVAEISRAMERDPLVFINVAKLKSKDETTFRHSIAVSALMVQFARYLKFDDETVRIMGVSGLLHDVGKMKIPDDVLRKEGGLTDSEFQTIRHHPSLGHAMLSSQADMPQVVLDVCLQHHERLDGKGYPMGLSGDEISQPVRMCTICDVYEAITSIRPYKKAWSQSDAIAWMLERQGHFDRSLLREFVSALGMMTRQSAITPKSL
jgi:putative nucleotidyltransferase with HDIG domain